MLALRAANLPYFAEQCEALGEAIEKQQVIDETAKLQEINAAKAAKVKAWSEMDAMSRMAANPPSARRLPKRKQRGEYLSSCQTINSKKGLLDELEQVEYNLRTEMNWSR